MTAPDNERLSALEARMDRLEARSPDTDLLQAIALTQSEHGRRLGRLEDDMRDLKADAAGLHGDMRSVKTQLGTVEAGINTIIHLLRNDDTQD